MRSMFCQVEFGPVALFVASAFHQPALVPRGERWKRYINTHLHAFKKLPQSLRSIKNMILQIVTKALNNLSGELSGKYYPLSKMTDAEQEQLINVSKSRVYACMKSDRYCANSDIVF